MFLEWVKACRELGIRFSPLYYFKLKKQYGERQRFYHTWDHIVNCMQVLNDNFRNEPNLARIKMALFFHDAVYNPMRKDNEAKSCEQFTEFAVKRMKLGGDNPTGAINIFRVVHLIEMTENHKLEEFPTRESAIMLDVDMSIMGAGFEEYMTYAVNVWREYSAHGREAYKAGRLAFLRGLDPHNIFSTPELRLLHSRTDLNISTEIHNLETNAENILL